MEQITCTHIFVERTLAIIKPDAVDKGVEIEDAILKAGFIILQIRQMNDTAVQIEDISFSGQTTLSETSALCGSKRRLQLSPEHCSNFYADQHGKSIFPRLVAFMSSGPVVAMTLAHSNAVDRWKTLMGPVNSVEAKDTHPESLRAIYGTSELKNALHGSESLHAAEREIKFMFPNSVLEPTPTKESTQEYLSRYVNPTLLRGLTELCQNKPSNPCVWLADWLMKNSPNNPKICDSVIVKEAELETKSDEHL